MNKLQTFFSGCANYFPLWVVGGALLALWRPETALWFKPAWIPLFIGVIMASMGLTLEVADFKYVLRVPRSILLGVSFHYIIMPALGYALAKQLHLPLDYMIGLILVACCPAGAASNVINFIARANLALSVSLTMCSTLAAVVMTPLLTAWLVETLAREMAGVPLRVDTFALLADTFSVVIVPVAVGVVANHFFHESVKKVTAYTPFLAVLSIVLIVNYILAARKEAILQTGGALLLAVALLHTCGFALGYLAARLSGFAENDRRTIAVEVGMQNSGLAAELARANFPLHGLATVPGAVSAFTQCIIASLLAAVCRLIDSRKRAS